MLIEQGFGPGKFADMGKLSRISSIIFTEFKANSLSKTDKGQKHNNQSKI